MFESIILIILIISIIVYKLTYKSVIITVEAFNKETFLVRDLPDALDASNMLATIMITLRKLVNQIIEDYNNSDKDLLKNLNKMELCQL